MFYNWFLLNGFVFFLFYNSFFLLFSFLISKQIKSTWLMSNKRKRNVNKNEMNWWWEWEVMNLRLPIIFISSITYSMMGWLFKSQMREHLITSVVVLHIMDEDGLTEFIMIIFLEKRKQGKMKSLNVLCESAWWLHNNCIIIISWNIISILWCSFDLSCFSVFLIITNFIDLN